MSCIGFILLVAFAIDSLTDSPQIFTERSRSGSAAVPWLRRLAAGLPPRRSMFDPGSVRVGFVVDKVALGQVFPRVLRFSPVNFIPPVLHYYEKDKI
jgi:hypothetical protein